MSLTEKQKIFCQEYVYDWNATRAYKKAYPDVKNDNTAGVQGHKLLRNAKVNDYISRIQKDTEKQAGLSRLMVAMEHKKLAFSSMSALHNTWITRKEFDELSDDEKACISEISTSIRKVNDGNEIVDVEYVKIKLYDKQKSLEALAKMFGYNEAEKMDLKHTSENLEISIGGKKFKA